MTVKEAQRLAVVETKLDIVIDRLDDMQKAFAGKWVEKALIFVGMSIGGILIGSIMALILTKPEVATIPTTKTVTVTVNPNGTTTTKTDEDGKTTTSTRPSTSDETPGTTTVTTEERNKAAENSGNGIFSSLIDRVRNQLGGNK